MGLPLLLRDLHSLAIQGIYARKGKRVPERQDGMHAAARRVGTFGLSDFTLLGAHAGH
jgi:hypothetical protein